MKNNRKWKQLAGIEGLSECGRPSLFSRFNHLTKRTLPVLALTLGAMPLMPSMSQGVELFSDDFTYADGSLTDTAAWSAHSGVGSDSVLVAAGMISLTHGSGSREDVSASFTARTTGKIYFGFDFSVADPGGAFLSGGNEYFVHFLTGTSTFYPKVDVVPPSGSGDFSVGIATSSSPADATWAADLNFGQTYRCVVEFDIDIDQAKLWIDPAFEGDTSILGVDGSVTRTVDTIAFRQNDSATDETVAIDNLVVATTFGEASGAAPPSGFLFAEPGVVTLDETGGTETITVSLIGTPPSDSFTLSLSSSDTSEATVPASVDVIGFADSVTFDITAVDDALADGPQSVTVSVSGAGFGSTTVIVTVNDDGDPFGLVINEIYSVPDAVDGDANGDGAVGSSDDEFIEIVNYGATPVNLTGCKLTDASNDIHYFPAGTILEPGCALVVFGGGGLFDGVSAGVFGNAEVQKSSEGLIFLTDGGDTISIHDATDEVLFSMVVPDLSGTTALGSYNLDSDGIVPVGVAAYDRHATLSGAPTEQFSPGTLVAGTAFCAVPSVALTLAVDNGSVAEDGGAGVATATIAIPAVLAADLEVHLETGDSSELVPQSFDATIALGATSVTILLDAVNDLDADGTQMVVLSANASGYENGTTIVDVTDDGDLPPFTGLVINEFDADPLGADGDGVEYIELFDTSGTGGSLDGLVLVLINGFDDKAYQAIDLIGNSIPAGGFFTLSNGLPPGDIELPTLQNGTDAIALYVGSAMDYDGKEIGAFPVGAPIDVVIYGSSVDAELEAFFGISTLSEGTEAEALARVVDGTGGFVAQAPTPGATNDLTVTGPGIQITAFSMVPSTGVGSATFTDSGVPFYRIQESNDLDQLNPWALVDVGTYSQTPNGDGTITLDFTDDGADGVSPRFYRVVEAP